MKMRFSTRLSLTYVSALILLAACGGGSGGADTAAGSSKLTGLVIDGYIGGATVCLDVDGDGACGDSEPSDTTDPDGSYTLDTSDQDTTDLFVIAEILDTASDSDDDGLTLAEAGKSAYIMAAPAVQADQTTREAFITPLTTLVVGKVKAGIDLDAAEAQVLQQQGLSANTNLYADHIDQSDSLTHNAARVVARQLQQAYNPNWAIDKRWTNLLEALAAAESKAGTVVDASVSDLEMPASLADVATGQLFAYHMTGAKGQPIQATAMLFKPSGDPPSTGWPLVVFGHGTTGVAQHCAPSVTLAETVNWGYADVVAPLLGSGYVVVVPDYEGLGSSNLIIGAEGHPYLNLRSAGQSMVLAAVAAKNLLGGDLSGDWAAMGHSQGGHAALAAAQFSGLAPQLTYKGAVAVAPASNFLASLNAMSKSVASSSPAEYPAAYETVGISSLYTAYLVKGTQSTPTPIAAADVLGSNMLGLYNSYNEDTDLPCLNAFSEAIGADIETYAYSSPTATPANYPGVIVPSVPSEIAAFLESNEPGLVPLPGKTLLVQGSADTTVLPAMTQKLAENMEQTSGGVGEVSLSIHESPDATHSGVFNILAAQEAIASHLQTLFSSDSSAASQ